MMSEDKNGHGGDKGTRTWKRPDDAVGPDMVVEALRKACMSQTPPPQKHWS